VSTPEDNNDANAPAESPETTSSPADESAPVSTPAEASAAMAAPAESAAIETASDGGETGAAIPNPGPLGHERGIVFVLVLYLVTIGIYGIYWVFKSFSEVKHHRREGVGGILGLLLCLVIVGWFKLPQYVGRMYRAEGNANPPVSGLSGLWPFVPYVGTFIYLAKVQGALNSYWQAKGTGTVGAVPASATTF
jgi:hypothetical protein